jgi:hypothetical protein
MHVHQQAPQRRPAAGGARRVPTPAMAAMPARAAAPRHRFADLSVLPPAAAPARALVPAPATAAAPVQLQTPWWKKLLIGAGIVGGTAAAITGAAMASPLLGLGGAAVALGGAYAAHRENEKAKTKLDFAPDPGTRAAMQQHMGADPKVSFTPTGVTSRYTAQEMMEQYPSAQWQAPLSNMIDGGAGRRPVPADEAGHAGAAGLRRKIDAAFSPPGVFEASEAATAERRAAASQQATAFNFQHHDNRRTARVIGRDRRILRNAPDTPTALTNILARHDGITFGEAHGDPSTKKFISRHLGTMAASGVNTLYMEHFRAEHQEHLDKFLAGESMSPELHRYVLNHDLRHNGGKSRLRNVLKAARAHGVRVRAIDSQTAASPDGAGQGGKAIREAAMNHVAHEAITGDAGRDGGKYAILTGAAHNNTQPPTTYGYRQGFERGAPGLSQLLDIPAVKINQGRAVLDEEDKTNRRKLARNLR